MTTATLSRTADKMHEAAETKPIHDTTTTTCAIVGGGPAGAILALLLARQGIDVTLLEKFSDFDRDFRGDTVHPASLELLEQMGLIEQVLQIPHGKLKEINVQLDGGDFKVANLSQLKSRYPYVAMMPQDDLISLLVAEAGKFPNFHLHMGANVHELIRDGAVVRGVTYDDRAGRHELRALLTVGADGRFSKVRQLIDEPLVKAAPAIDVVWFRVSRQASDGELPFGTSKAGVLFVCLPRPQQWQLGYIILKGSYKQVQAQGIEHLRAEVAALMPPLADRVDELRDWKQVAFLSVESSRVKQWWRPGLLLIGDAAHVMSPVGGVGINYAIQDAVAAANLLSQPLKRGRVTEWHLQQVQKRREWPTQVIQRFQAFAQERVLKQSLQAGGSLQVPLPLRLPVVGPLIGRLLARFIAYGVRPERVQPQAAETNRSPIAS